MNILDMNTAETLRVYALLGQPHVFGAPPTAADYSLGYVPVAHVYNQSDITFGIRQLTADGTGPMAIAGYVAMPKRYCMRARRSGLHGDGL